MPFTFSHPFIVLPFVKNKTKWFSTTSLIIGSMAPDFEYFLNFRILSFVGHTIPGILFFTLPLTIIFSLLFHKVVRNELIKHLPSPLDHRLSGYLKYNFTKDLKSNWHVFLYSAIIGILSHIVLDGFTHSTGYFVSRYHIFNKTIPVILFDIPAYSIIQHSLSLIGLFIIVKYILSLNKINSDYLEICTKQKRRYWILITVSTLIIFCVLCFFRRDYLFVGNVIVLFINALFISLIFSCSNNFIGKKCN